LPRARGPWPGLLAACCAHHGSVSSRAVRTAILAGLWGSELTQTSRCLSSCLYRAESHSFSCPTSSFCFRSRPPGVTATRRLPGAIFAFPHQSKLPQASALISPQATGNPYHPPTKPNSRSPMLSTALPLRTSTMEPSSTSRRSMPVQSTSPSWNVSPTLPLPHPQAV
jgi:hypothetical protein